VNYLGPGFILFFSLIKWLIYLFIPLSIAGYLWVQQSIKNDKCNALEDCKLDYITKYSVVNYGFKENSAQGLFYFILAILLIYYFSIINVSIERKDHFIDAENDVPEDFTLMITGLPKGEDNNTILERFELASKMCQPPDSNSSEKNIVKINLAFKSKRFDILNTDFEKKINKLLIVRNEALKKLGIEPGDQYSEEVLGDDYRDASLDYINADILLEIEEKKVGTLEFSSKSLGVAFLTFRTKSIMNNFLKYWGAQRTCSQKLWRGGPTTPYPHMKNGRKIIKYLEIHEAPAPSDIIWEHLGLSFRRTLGKRIATFIVSFILLAISFVIIFLLKKFQKEVRDKQTSDKYTEEVSNFRGISYLISLVIVGVNYILSILLRKFTDLEYRNTHTATSSSLAIKISIAQFVNSCLMIVFAHIATSNELKDVYASGNLG